MDSAKSEGGMLDLLEILSLVSSHQRITRHGIIVWIFIDYIINITLNYTDLKIYPVHFDLSKRQNKASKENPQCRYRKSLGSICIFFVALISYKN